MSSSSSRSTTRSVFQGRRLGSKVLASQTEGTVNLTEDGDGSDVDISVGFGYYDPASVVSDEKHEVYSSMASAIVTARTDQCPKQTLSKTPQQEHSDNDEFDLPPTPPLISTSMVNKCVTCISYKKSWKSEIEASKKVIKIKNSEIDKLKKDLRHQKEDAKMKTDELKEKLQKSEKVFKLWEEDWKKREKEDKIKNFELKTKVDAIKCLNKQLEKFRYNQLDMVKNNNQLNLTINELKSSNHELKEELADYNGWQQKQKCAIELEGQMQEMAKEKTGLKTDLDNAEEDIFSLKQTIEDLERVVVETKQSCSVNNEENSDLEKDKKIDLVETIGSDTGCSGEVSSSEFDVENRKEVVSDSDSSEAVSEFSSSSSSPIKTLPSITSTELQAMKSETGDTKPVIIEPLLFSENCDLLFTVNNCFGKKPFMIIYEQYLTQPEQTDDSDDSSDLHKPNSNNAETSFTAIKRAKTEQVFQHKTLDITDWRLLNAEKSFEIYFKLNSMKDDRRFKRHFMSVVNRQNFYDIWKISDCFKWFDCKQIVEEIIDEVICIENVLKIGQMNALFQASAWNWLGKFMNKLVRYDLEIVDQDSGIKTIESFRVESEAQNDYKRRIKQHSVEYRSIGTQSQD